MSIYSLNPDSCPMVPPDNSSMSNIYFNSELTTPGCDLSDAYHFQAEVLRTGWILGSLMAYQVRDSIGTGLLKNTWEYHPLLGSLQNSFNTLSNRVSRLAHCSSDPVFSAVQRGLSSLRQSLKKEKVPSDLRSQLGLDRVDLGDFSGTPLIVSDNGPDLPNVISLKEFEYLQQVYSAVENGDSPLTIDASVSPQFRRQILSAFRIILSTQVGRGLLYALHKSGKPICIKKHLKEEANVGPGKEPAQESAFYSSKTQVVAISDSIEVKMFFGAPNEDKVAGPSLFFSVLFHELLHAYHDLITGDKLLFSEEVHYGDPWGSREEKRTVLATNELQRQLKMGEAGWYGQWGRHTFKTTLPASLDLTERVKMLFSKRARIDDQTNVSESKRQLYNGEGAIDGVPFCASINKHLQYVTSSLPYELKDTDQNKASEIRDDEICHDWLNTILTSEGEAKVSSKELVRAIRDGLFEREDESVGIAILSSKKALELSSEDLSSLLITASSWGYEGMVQTILNSERAPKISPNRLATALHLNAVNKNGIKGKKIAQAILNSERALEIRPETLNRAFALVSENAAIVQKIFPKLSWTNKIKYYLGLS